eukprot:scaffold136871_cov63-Phaeocystis_antarctica.AAC.3
MRGVVLQMVLRAPASSLTHCRAPKEEICPAAFQSNGFAIEIEAHGLRELFGSFGRNPRASHQEPLETGVVVSVDESQRRSLELEQPVRPEEIAEGGHGARGHVGRHVARCQEPILLQLRSDGRVEVLVILDAVVEAAFVCREP